MRLRLDVVQLTHLNITESKVRLVGQVGRGIGRFDQDVALESPHKVIELLTSSIGVFAQRTQGIRGILHEALHQRLPRQTAANQRRGQGEIHRCREQRFGGRGITSQPLATSMNGVPQQRPTQHRRQCRQREGGKHKQRVDSENRRANGTVTNRFSK